MFMGYECSSHFGMKQLYTDSVQAINEIGRRISRAGRGYSG